MADNPFTVDLGSVAPFVDNRTLVQNTAPLIREQEELRQSKVELGEKLRASENNAKLLGALGELGIRVGEIATINALYGSAENEAEAISLIEQQGAAVADTYHTLTDLAQARARSDVTGMSYERTQNEMARLLRKAKHDNPLFAYVIDEAASKFVTGVPTGQRLAQAGNGTLATLSVAEQEMLAFKGEAAAIKIRSPQLSDDYITNYLNKRQLLTMEADLAEQRKKITLAQDASNEQVSGLVAETYWMAENTFIDDVYLKLNEAMAQRPLGLTTEDRVVLKSQVKQARSTMNAALRAEIETIRQDNPNFLMDTDILSELERKTDNDFNEVLSFLDEENFEQNMQAINRATEASMDQYILTNWSEMVLLRDGLFKGDIEKFLAYSSNSMLEKLYKKNPELKSLVEDFGLTTNEGYHARTLNAYRGVFSEVKPESLLDDVAIVTADQVNDPDKQQAVADFLAEPEGSAAVRALADTAAADTDIPSAYLSMPAYVQKGNESPEYAIKVLKPITDKGLQGVRDSILLDNQGANPNLTIEEKGILPSEVRIGRPGQTIDELIDQYGEEFIRYEQDALSAPLRLDIDGVRTDQLRNLNEMYNGLMTNSNIMGISPSATAREKADAALEYVTERLAPVLQTQPDTIPAGVDAQSPEDIEQLPEDVQRFYNELKQQGLDQEVIDRILENRGFEEVDGTLIRRR